jgi:high-affinity Fe2+/Pb2+ permease
MHLLDSRNVAVWGMAGATLSFALVFLLAWTFGKLGGAWQQGPAYFLSSFIFAGPDAIWRSGPWQAPLEGASIGAVLCLIDRAFNRVEEAETTPHASEPAAAPAGQSQA